MIPPLSQDKGKPPSLYFLLSSLLHEADSLLLGGLLLLLLLLITFDAGLILPPPSSYSEDRRATHGDLGESVHSIAAKVFLLLLLLLPPPNSHTLCLAPSPPPSLFGPPCPSAIFSQPPLPQPCLPARLSARPGLPARPPPAKALWVRSQTCGIRQWPLPTFQTVGRREGGRLAEMRRIFCSKAAAANELLTVGGRPPPPPPKKGSKMALLLHYPLQSNNPFLFKITSNSANLSAIYRMHCRICTVYDVFLFQTFLSFSSLQYSECVSILYLYFSHMMLSGHEGGGDKTVLDQVPLPWIVLK